MPLAPRFSDPKTQSFNRRNLLKRLGIAGATGAVLATGSFPLHAATEATAAPDPVLIGLVQFAINFEYLVTEFFTKATTGETLEMAGIPIDGQGTLGATLGGERVHFREETLAADAFALAADERAHLLRLRSELQQIGVTPPAKPEINLDALGIGFENQRDFLTVARIFEDLGTAALAGAAAVPNVGSSSLNGLLGRLLAAEGQHVGIVRGNITRLGIQVKPVDGLDIVPPPAPNGKVFSTDSDGLMIPRTPGQLLFEAYGRQANVTSGGFFPMGVNSTINVSSSPA